MFNNSRSVTGKEVLDGVRGARGADLLPVVVGVHPEDGGLLAVGDGGLERGLAVGVLLGVVVRARMIGAK